MADLNCIKRDRIDLFESFRTPVVNYLFAIQSSFFTEGETDILSLKIPSRNLLCGIIVETNSTDLDLKIRSNNTNDITLNDINLIYSKTGINKRFEDNELNHILINGETPQKNRCFIYMKTSGGDPGKVLLNLMLGSI